MGKKWAAQRFYTILDKQIVWCPQEQPYMWIPPHPPVWGEDVKYYKPFEPLLNDTILPEPKMKFFSPTKIYIKNLECKVKMKTLRTLFSPFGSILDIRIPSDLVSNRQRGYAFVTFNFKESALNCVNHPPKLYGNKLKVLLSHNYGDE